MRKLKGKGEEERRTSGLVDKSERGKTNLEEKKEANKAGAFPVSNQL